MARPTPAPTPARRAVSPRMAGSEVHREGKGWAGSALSSRMALNTSNSVMAGGGGKAVTGRVGRAAVTGGEDAAGG